MTVYQTEGIVFHAIPFQDHAHILTVFTYDEGVAKFILKGNQGIVINVFSKIHLSYSKGKSDLYQCGDASLLNQHLNLRKSLQALQAAGELVQTVVESQMPYHANPMLYRLFASYLSQIPLIKDPLLLISATRNMMVLLTKEKYDRDRCQRRWHSRGNKKSDQRSWWKS